MCCFQSSVALSVHVWVACLDAYAYPKTQVEDTRHFVQQDIHVYVYEFPKTRVKDTKTNRGQGFSKTREGIKLLVIHNKSYAAIDRGAAPRSKTVEFLLWIILVTEISSLKV